MVAPASRPCPSRDELQAYCLGLLPDPALDTVARHVADCSTCRETLPEVQDQADSLVVHLRGVDQHPPYAHEQACRQLARRAKDLWQEVVPPPTLSVSDHTPQAGGETVVDGPAGRAAAEQDLRSTQEFAGADDGLPQTIGHYRIIRRLGRGGFGCVYLAYSALMRRHAAIKVPRLDRARSASEKQLLLQEAQAAAKLKHPGIVAIYDVGWLDDGRLFIAMEYIEGRTLAQVMAEGKMPPERAAELIAKVADAVHYAHKRGLFHRDLKPGNILIDQDGQPHVTDFGLAVHEDVQRRHAGEVAGTPAYMSPEQVRGDAHLLDGRTDIWSLGVILYELLTGRRPFNGMREQVFDEILHRDPKPPRQIDDNVPEELEQVCLKCLRKNPADRYTTCKDVAHAVTGARHGSRRIRFLVVAILGALALASVYGLVKLWPRGRPDLIEHVAANRVAYRVLQHRPIELFARPRTGSPRTWNYDEKTQELQLDSSGSVLLDLGKTACSSYTIRVDLNKSAWVGDVGIFLGYNPPLGENRTTFQLIMLRCRNQKTFSLLRETREVGIGERGPEEVAGRTVRGVPLDDRPGPDGGILEVRVVDGQLRNVLWNKKPVPRSFFDSPELTGMTTGSFGIFNDRGATRVIDVTFTPTNEGREP